MPSLRDFRSAYRSWLDCQIANGDAPEWSRNLADDHPVRDFLRVVESDWQAQRVSPYALLWGLCASPESPEVGYEQFFDRWLQWKSERSALDASKTWGTVRRKLGSALEYDRIAGSVREVLGEGLLAEVEGRLLYTVNNDHRQRHGGVLRAPSDLNLFAIYDRPEVIRHFGVHYDPAKHNTGMLWFGCDGVIITKLDTSTAIQRHQYRNRFIDDRTFSWTSQNRMGTENEAGLKVVEHESRGLRLHLFVQPRSHAPACYLGLVRVRGRADAEGVGPMQVRFSLSRSVPTDVLKELLVEADSEAIVVDGADG